MGTKRKALNHAIQVTTVNIFHASKKKHLTTYLLNPKDVIYGDDGKCFLWTEPY